MLKAQDRDIDIVPYLKQIEAGQSKEVKEKLPELKVKFPGSPAIMFLDGVLTEDGQQAVAIYQRIIDNYPNSKYADAAVYRVFSYFYALGLYEAAEKMRNKLEYEYPGSPYLKLADANPIPKFETPQVTQQPETKPIQPVEEPKKVPLESGFAIQAGAFTNSANAAILRDKFASDGFVTEIKDKTIGGTVFHVVYVGRYKTRNEAQDVLNIINPKYNLTGWIVEIKQ